MSDLQNVNEMHIDVFREIGNIGAGNAATALASILNKQIRMSVPEVRIVPFNEIVNILHGPETLVVGLLVDIRGDLNGFILVVLDMDNARDMASIAMGPEMAAEETAKRLASGDELTEFESSALVEIANILVGAYLSAIHSMTELNVRPATPQMAIDMVGAIVSVATIEYGQIGDTMLFLKTQFLDVEREMSGHFFLIPDFASYRVLLESLGVE